jgi:hypothetical protein
LSVLGQETPLRSRWLGFIYRKFISGHQLPVYNGLSSSRHFGR